MNSGMLLRSLEIRPNNITPFYAKLRLLTTWMHPSPCCEKTDEPKDALFVLPLASSSLSSILALSATPSIRFPPSVPSLSRSLLTSLLLPPLSLSLSLSSRFSQPISSLFESRYWSLFSPDNRVDFYIYQTKWSVRWQLVNGNKIDATE